MRMLLHACWILCDVHPGARLGLECRRMYGSLALVGSMEPQLEIATAFQRNLSDVHPGDRLGRYVCACMYVLLCLLLLACVLAS